MIASGANRLQVLREASPFDVCIVGSGFAGIVLAKDLVSRGVRTLVLESGYGLLRWLLDRRLPALAAYEFTGDTRYPLKRTKARIVGGNSNFWTGRAERFHPSDFEPHPYTPPENPWPIRYDDLEPYYCRAESTLRVAAGEFSRWAAPRSQPPPLPPRKNIQPLRELLRRVDVELDVSATAIPRRALRFFRVNHEILPSFSGAPHCVLVRGATVTRLETDDTGRVCGAEVRTLEGDRAVARAQYYVVACGGMETPRLLLLSRSQRFPRGIGNTYDRVGRGFNEHASINLYGSMRHSKGTIWPRHKIARSHQFYETYRQRGLGALLLNVIQSWVFPNHLLPFRLRDVPRYAGHLLERVVRPTLYLGTTIEMKVSDENRVTLSEKMRDAFGNPLCHLIFNYQQEDLKMLECSRELCLRLYRGLAVTRIREAEVNFSMHHQGTCRMGDNPKTSVVDRNLRVHECANLFLCGAEVFVTGSAVPPTLTIVALAHRLGDHLTALVRRPGG